MIIVTGSWLYFHLRNINLCQFSEWQVSSILSQKCHIKHFLVLFWTTNLMCARTELNWDFKFSRWLDLWLWFSVFSHLWRVFMNELFYILCYFLLNSYYISKAKISYMKFRSCGVGVRYVHCCPWFLPEHVQYVHRPPQNTTCKERMSTSIFSDCMLLITDLWCFEEDCSWHEP
jgi:hypothetical protein